MKLSRIMLFTASALAATSAQAADYSIADLAHSYMTYTTIDAVSAARTSSYTGVGSLFVSYESTAVTGFGSLCTGSLINATTVLTAAHCIFDYDEAGARDAVTGISFYLPSFGERRAADVTIINASAWQYNPLYNNGATEGDIGSGHDLALFTLSEAATGFETYELYLGDPLQQYIEVGTGTIGGPAGTGIGTTDDYQRRTGNNIYEFYGDDVFSDVTHGVVLADFDDGTAQHDVFGRNLGLSQRGVANEASSSPGDSGGPSFIDGKIAAVTSFGITGGIFQGFCGGTSTDPYNANGQTRRTNNLANCTNSSVGEIMGNTLVSYNTDFINSYLAGVAAVPEPASWAMMIGGFGVVGGSLRRRKVRTTVSFA